MFHLMFVSEQQLVDCSKASTDQGANSSLWLLHACSIHGEVCECRTSPLDASQLIHVYTHVLFEPSIYVSLNISASASQCWRPKIGAAPLAVIDEQ